MRYAHLCQGVTENYPFATFERLMTGLLVPTTRAGRFPVPSVLVSSFIAMDAPGRRELLITFTDHQANIISETRADLKFKVREPGYPGTAHQAMKLQDIEIPGPGIYYFDFLVDQVHVGRLPVVMLADTTPTSFPAGQVQMGGEVRPGIMLDWGHLLDRFEHQSDGTLTLHHVYEVWPVLSDPTKPFAMDAKLLLHLSAPTSFAGEHRLAVIARDAAGQRLGDTGGVFTLAPTLPGRVGVTHCVDLKGLGFPCSGDYSLEVLADGDRIGSIDVFARPARLEPMGDG